MTTWSKTSGGRPGFQPSTDERTGTRGCGKSQPQRVTKYNEFYGGVRCYTFISQRAEQAHIQRDAAGGGEPRGADHGKEATAAGANSNNLIQISESKQNLVTQLTDRITECGTDQICWLNINWVKQIKDYDIHNNTFNPF